MKAANLVPVIGLLLLAGCGTLESINENNEMDRSLPHGTPVHSGSISARTPFANLLQEQHGNDLCLRTVNIGIVPPSRYTALHNTLNEFTKVVEKDRKTAESFKTFASSVKGIPTTIYFARYQKGDVVELVYYLYLGDPANGYSAELDEYYRSTAFSGEAWWDKVPREFAEFLESLEFAGTSNANR